MRSTRPLRLEALEERSVPAHLGWTGVVPGATGILPSQFAAYHWHHNGNATGTTVQATVDDDSSSTSGGFAGGLIGESGTNQGTTTPIVPIDGSSSSSGATSSLGNPIVPVGTPVDM